MELRYSENGETVFLPEECVIENAAAIKEALLKALEDPKTARVDASGVRRLDLAGIQLFYAFLRSGNRGEGRLAWTGTVPDIVSRALDASGYSGMMLEYRIA